MNIGCSTLQARETIDQLVYIAETDNSHVVKARSKETLNSFGKLILTSLTWWLQFDSTNHSNGIEYIHIVTT
jgi:hypothetical protein